MNMDALSQLVETARRQAGLTQQALAGRAGMPQSVIARIESGRANPTIRTVQRLLDATGFGVKLHLVSKPLPDPVVQRYKQDVDRTLLRENLKKTPDQRIREMIALLEFGEEAGRAVRRAKRRR
jgi:transcriptional regulator with XRE-family HTH domain